MGLLRALEDISDLFLQYQLPAGDIRVQRVEEPGISEGGRELP